LEIRAELIADTEVGQYRPSTSGKTKRLIINEMEFQVKNDANEDYFVTLIKSNVQDSSSIISDVNLNYATSFSTSQGDGPKLILQSFRYIFVKFSIFPLLTLGGPEPINRVKKFSTLKNSPIKILYRLLMEIQDRVCRAKFKILIKLFYDRSFKIYFI
jgi:hypothetical protein